MLCLRHATPDDLEAIEELETVSFPPEEAADRTRLQERLAIYPECFWLLFDEKKLLAYSCGLATECRDLADEMYANASLHEKNGAWQMLFSVCTDPMHRGEGLAHHVLSEVIAESCARKRAGIVLTCKEALVPFYREFGFADEGVSDSAHGGLVWHQVRRHLGERNKAEGRQVSADRELFWDQRTKRGPRLWQRLFFLCYKQKQMHPAFA